MEVITIESQAYKELTAKINMIADYVAAAAQSEAGKQNEDEWVTSHEVCTFLKISARTLQRLRADDAINFSRIRGKNYYKISEIQRLLQNKVIRRSEEQLQDLIENHRLQIEKKRHL